MKTRILSVLSLLICLFVLANDSSAQGLWKEVSPASQSQYANRNQASLPESGKFKFYSLDVAQLRSRITMAGTIGGLNGTPAELEFPLADGTMVEADVYESSILTPALQALLPNVRTYALVDRLSGSSLGRITVTSTGVTGLLFSRSGTAYLHPLDGDNQNTHIAYFTKEIRIPENVICALKDEPVAARPGEANRVDAGDCQLRTYRLAVAATGEYFLWAGSQVNALTYITICINTVNAIYERDATIRFTIVTTNDIIYMDPTTDPYPSGVLNGTVLDANNIATDAELGAGSYDVGIVFNNGWSGGLAQLNSVCTGAHGRSAAGLTFGTGANPTPGPQGPVFDGTVAHEIGHQFGATHTMAANNGGCLGNNTAATAFEPGGGSTIMAYAGTCTGNYYQFNSDLYFHGANIFQIANFATNLAGSICPVTTPLTNVGPNVVVAAPAYTIPVSTPFMLTSTGSDGNGNTLTYNWEQLDGNALTSSPPSAAATTGPNFRSFSPSYSPTRYFPNLASIVAASATPYEVLPSVTRSMTFWVTVRDNASGGGCNAQEEVAVSTNAAGGPFTVTSQNTPTTLSANGSNTFTINWNVAATNAAPFNTSNVDILFSADGGQNFNYTLLANTANDGSQSILVPNIPTSAGRIMVRAVGNIFFNVNAANITISSTCGAEGASLSPSATVTASPGNNALNLASVPNYGAVILPTSGASFTSGDPTSSLAVYSSVTTSCVTLGNQFRYDLYTFQVNAAGTYTFGKSGGTYVMNLYTGSYNPSTPCQNFIASSGTFNGSTVSLASSVSGSLVPGVTYVLAVGTFSASQPTIPFAYTITLTGAPGGGNVYSGYPNPGVGFSYAYVIVNNATNNIIAISSTPDLRNSATFPIGTYSVYGLSYLTAHFSPAALNAYVGNAYSILTTDLFSNPSGMCGNLSKNLVPVNISVVLPVRLLPLTAVKDGNKVKLYWSTESEINSREFEIERSVDGSSFTTIKSHPASGNSQSRVNYTTIDENPLPGSNHYRIKANSFDGSISYTNIALVKYDWKGFVVNTYPNPVKDKLVMEVITMENTVARMEISSSNGSQVLVRSVQLAKGINYTTFDLQSLPSGLYYIKLTSAAGTATSKIIKL